MKKKSTERISVPEDYEDVEEDYASDESVDSDEELQVAFEAGRLGPGLNAIVPLKKRILVNNLTGLSVKLDEMKQDLAWIQRLDLVNEPLQVTDSMVQQFGDIEIKRNKHGDFLTLDADDSEPQNDFKREMLFLRQAQASVLEGLPKLAKLGVKTKRPADYFAQMLKSDSQMAKIAKSLESKQESLLKSEKAKKLREMKKMGKKIQQEVLLGRQKEKREMLDKVKAYKKGKVGNLDFDLDGKHSKKGGASRSKKGGAKGGSKSSKKQVKKNDTYGFGGQKKRGKSNNADSFSQDFSLKRHNARGGRGGGSSARGGKKQAQKRPGKNRRQQMRGR